ncbi:MAG: ABC transporter ATP-binding protein, partial [Eubacteriales bacterium]|nr:ABC transporter ATP-binding protein [Eubacteriales bacterium]
MENKKEGKSEKKNKNEIKNGLRFPTNRSLILFFLRGSLGWFAAGAVCACLVALFDLVIPRLIQFTVDAVIGEELSSLPRAAAAVLARLGGAEALRARLWAAGLSVAAAAALGAVSRYAFGVCNAKGAEIFMQRTRNQLFSHILSLPYSWQGENSTGDIIQRCTSDVETIKIFVSEQLTSLLRVFILVFLSLYFMASIQPRLTLAAAVFIPVMIVSSLIFYGLIGDEFEKVDSEEGRLSAIAQENLTGVRVVRTFGREKFERERFEAQNEFYTNHWIRLMKVLAAFWVSGNVIATVRNMTVAVYGAVLCVHGRLTAGGLIAFLSYNALMSLPVRSIGRVIAEMSKA